MCHIIQVHLGIIKKLCVRCMCVSNSLSVYYGHYFLLSSELIDRLVLFFIVLCLVLRFLQWECHLLFMFELITFFASEYVMPFIVKNVIETIALSASWSTLSFHGMHMYSGILKLFIFGLFVKITIPIYFQPLEYLYRNNQV